MPITFDYDAWSPTTEAIPRRLGMAGKGTGPGGPSNANVPISMKNLEVALFSNHTPVRGSRARRDAIATLGSALSLVLLRFRQLEVPAGDVQRIVKAFPSRGKPQVQAVLDAALTPANRISNPKNKVPAVKADHRYRFEEPQTGVWSWRLR